MGKAGRAALVGALVGIGAAIVIDVVGDAGINADRVNTSGWFKEVDIADITDISANDFIDVNAVKSSLSGVSVEWGTPKRKHVAYGAGLGAAIAVPIALAW